ncbi:hypothetical protein WJX73_010028 [Symbiochloris irregularis]|uniref:Carboxymuconolactone decarboxylase-like domain-containing protein n=1 Tax=Symbiochloris irregularis TaxID=706552 RepID=A0AAW1PCN0_9CHLO
MPLSQKDEALVQLFMAGCHHRWDDLTEMGQTCYSAGCSVPEVRGCIRHLIVAAGYTTCLAAGSRLLAAQLLPVDTPGKVSGPPGNAFELVFDKVAPAVRNQLHQVDPVLGAYISRHAYGDVYSSPGISLRQKELLMCAYLGQANMSDQLFSHIYAAMRFGSDREACEQAMDIGFQRSDANKDEPVEMALRQLDMAAFKMVREFPKGAPEEPEIELLDSSCVCIPELEDAPIRSSGRKTKSGGKSWAAKLTPILTGYYSDVDAGLGGLGGLPTP